MKKNIVYILMLCIAFCMSACHCDDEDESKVIRTYPTEEQIPFDKENIKGYLTYYKDYKKWCFRPEHGVYTQEFIQTTNWGIEFWMFVENMNKEYESLAGKVTIDGTYLFLYEERGVGTETSLPITKYFYSLKIKKISKAD